MVDSANKKIKKGTEFSKIVLNEAELIDQIKHSMADLEKLIDEMGKRYKSESKSRKTIESLRPFLDGVGRYSAVIDTMVSSNPMVSALIWGGFKFILIVSLHHPNCL